MPPLLSFLANRPRTRRDTDAPVPRSVFFVLGKVGELLALWREEFPKGMPADEYARKRNQLRPIACSHIFVPAYSPEGAPDEGAMVAGSSHVMPN